MDVTPFHLMSLEISGERWSLYLSSLDSTDSRDVFEHENRHPGAYGWEGVALYFLEEVVDDEIANRIELDCENDALVARSAGREALLTLAELMVPLVHDRAALASILRKAPLDGWSSTFLG